MTDWTTKPTVNLSPEEKEKHEIFLLLSLSLVFSNWNIRKHRTDEREAYEEVFPGVSFGEYTGHNIGALLVDKDDQIITYSFNCNHLHNNSTEHAEARLVRKSLRIYNKKRFMSGKGAYGYSQVLRDHTIYSTLESCSQCSGIMDLANVERVVYAQVDPGQYHIGDILYNMHHFGKGSGAPLPISGEFSRIFPMLENAYSSFGGNNTAANGRPGMTTFLRSLEAYAVFQEASKMLLNFEVQYPKNQGVLARCHEFQTHYPTIEDRDATFGD